MSMYGNIDFSKMKKGKPQKGPFLTAERKRKLMTGFLIAVGSLALLYGGVKGVNWIIKHPGKPPADAKPQEVAKFVASDSFNSLSLVEKEELLKKMRPSGGPPPGTMPDSGMRMRPPQMDASFRTVMEKSMEVREQRMKKTAKEYFSLPKAEREAWMASHVAEQEKMRAEMRARFGQRGQGAAGGQRQGASSSQGGGQGGPPPGGGGDGPGGPPP